MEVNYCGCGAWYHAKISDVLSDPLRYVVNYEDGSVMEEADSSNIRKLVGDEREMVPSGVVEVTNSALSSQLDMQGAADGAETAHPPYFVNSDETAFILERYEILGGLGALLLARAKDNSTTDDDEDVQKQHSAQYTEIFDIFTEASEIAMEEGKTKLAMKYVEYANIASVEA